ncbi:hypothetical protein BDZ91DRAFT_724251 [Kalaharituber pfeilii]|nr:hypothetical protein BDZ91DRAFT_724251 [Kalaharituber pfeilii]
MYNDSSLDRGLGGGTVSPERFLLGRKLPSWLVWRRWWCVRSFLRSFLRAIPCTTMPNFGVVAAGLFGWNGDLALGARGGLFIGVGVGMGMGAGVGARVGWLVLYVLAAGGYPRVVMES